MDDEENECIICHDPIDIENQINVICNNCGCLVCINCNHVYRNSYNYNKCPKCRRFLNHVYLENNTNHLSNSAWQGVLHLDHTRAEAQRVGNLQEIIGATLDARDERQQQRSGFKLIIYVERMIKAICFLFLYITVSYYIGYSVTKIEIWSLNIFIGSLILAFICFVITGICATHVED